jgi:uncharacterized membrane protein YfcA
VDFFADPQLLALVLGIMLLGGVVHGALGFGFPLLATPLLAALFDVRTAILLTLFPTVAVNIASLIGERGLLRGLRQYWPLIGYAALGSVLGTLLLLRADPEPFRLLLAGMILLHLWQSRSTEPGAGWAAGHPRLAQLGFGLVAGFAAGTVNVMVPVLIIYATQIGLGVGASIVVFNACFLAGKSAQIAVFGGAPSVQFAEMLRTLVLLVPALAALWVGRGFRRRIDATFYRRVLRVVLFGLALLLIGQFLR